MNKQLILNDRVVKLIGIPALGLIVPNLTGLIDNRLYTFSELAASYLFFIVVAFLVWEGNVRLMYYIRAKIPWSKRSYYRVIIALFFANIVYSGILSASFLRLWVLASHEARTDNDHLVSSVLVIIIACFITNIYEISKPGKGIQRIQGRTAQHRQSPGRTRSPEKPDRPPFYLQLPKYPVVPDHPRPPERPPV